MNRQSGMSTYGRTDPYKRMDQHRRIRRQSTCGRLSVRREVAA
ncbi:hypothetical protein AB0C27_03575 [Nonomuraea sp. NPDC048882]